MVDLRVVDAGAAADADDCAREPAREAALELIASASCGGVIRIMMKSDNKKMEVDVVKRL
ncbi:hypothetical protein HDU76_010464, partial [Blyttiomyces sp. JEL0837]